MAAIFHFRHTQETNSLLTSLFVLPYSGNKGVALEISLLSCIEAELYVISFPLPVNGSHLLFPTYPDIWQSLHLSPRAASVRSYGLTVGLSLPSCKLAEIRETTFFSAAILEFWLPVPSGSVTDSTIEKFDPENIGVAVLILFLASLEA